MVVEEGLEGLVGGLDAGVGPVGRASRRSSSVLLGHVLRRLAMVWDEARRDSAEPICCRGMGLRVGGGLEQKRLRWI